MAPSRISKDTRKPRWTLVIGQRTGLPHPLLRELRAAGLLLRAATNARQIVAAIGLHGQPDLVVIDPDLDALPIRDVLVTLSAVASHGNAVEPLHTHMYRYMLNALELCNGNKSAAARMLGINRITFKRKLLKLPVGL